MQRRNFLAAGIACGAVTAGAAAAARAAMPAPPLLADPWLGGPAPDSASLRGKVSLVNFWTYSCIFALRCLPYLRRWHAEYGPAGLQIIGIHTPEFAFEHLRANVEDAVAELDIRFAVGQDNAYRTWRAWRNRAWPSFYVVDRNGQVTMVREGEGHSMEMERAIRTLLGLSPDVARRQPSEDTDLSQVRSPEMYFGAQHGTPQEPGQSPRRGQASYAFSQAGPQLNRYELEGLWAREDEALTLMSDRGRLRMRYSAAKLHLVAGAPDGAVLRFVRGDGARRDVRVRRPALYTVVDGESYGDQMVEIEVMSRGLSLYSATFG
jgi:thiol-disulfide isomerase/thioredoxin